MCGFNIGRSRCSRKCHVALLVSVEDDAAPIGRYGFGARDSFGYDCWIRLPYSGTGGLVDAGQLAAWVNSCNYLWLTFV